MYETASNYIKCAIDTYMKYSTTKSRDFELCHNAETVIL